MPDKTIKNKKEKKTKVDTTEPTLVLLDAHAILHRAYHALPDFATAKGEPTGALYGLSAMLIKIIAELKPDYIAAAFDLQGPTYRHEAYDAYKAQRKKTEDDLAIQINRSHEVFDAFGIPQYSLAGFEADDILGTIVEKKKDIKIIVASGDMDTLQLVEDDRVLVYTLKKGINDTILYNESAVKERFGFPPNMLPDYKGLRGDPSDNIIGIKGIGEKTATTLITTFGTIENMYKVLKKNPDKFKDVGLTERIINLLKDNEEEAIFSKMLATIRRDAPIEFSLPEKTWRDGFDMDKAESTFRDLEFRTLGNRLKEVLNKDLQPTTDNLQQEESTGQLTFGQVEGVLPKSEEVEEVGLALWVLNSNFTNPTLDDVLQFAQTKDFAKAKEIIFSEIKNKNLAFIYEEIEKPLIPIIKKMEERGVKIDKAKLRELSKTYHKEQSRLEKEIWEYAGEEFNVASPKQVGEILFVKMGLSAKSQKKTSTGQKSTKESELEKMKDLHPIVGKVLEYREFAKLLSTYIDNIPTLLDKTDRLHTSLRQTGSTTGRMSSTNPNLQNIPIKTELGRNIRHAFVAEEGFSLVSIDYSQIELRVAAILSEDPKFLDIFHKEEDVHSAVASYVFNVPIENVDKTMRNKAKTINFGILYGMGVNALRQNLGGTREEAQNFYNEYFKRFTGLASYLEDVKADAARLGYTETLFGRRRYFEGIKSKIPYIRASAERMAINAPIQGTAADIMKLAMKEIALWIEKEKIGDDVHMILQVHDELLFEVKKGKEKVIATKLREIMENVMPKEKSNGVICRANVATGPSWGEMEEIHT